MERVAFIGLGAMGAPMAANLLKAGFPVTVFNRTAQRADSLIAQGAARASTPRDAASPGGVVVTMVADDAALEAVTTGPHGFGDRLGEDGIHLCMATVSPGIARKLAEWHAQRGSHYVAAPVFGRPPAAAAGKLWILCAGPQPAKLRVQPLLQAMGQGVFDFGEDPGAANVVKVAGNFLITCAIEGLAEAFAVGEKNGIDRKAMADFFTQTIFSCPLYQNYAPMVAAGRAEPGGFLLRLGLKDNKLLMDAAEQAGVPVPFGNLVRDRLISAVEKGRGEADLSAMGLGVMEDARH